VNHEPVNEPNGNALLPLFRSEALLAPERGYGEILRIRPFSWAVLGWVAGGIAVAVAGVLAIFRG